jgi:hypothetical protein
MEMEKKVVSPLVAVFVADPANRPFPHTREQSLGDDFLHCLFERRE